MYKNSRQTSSTHMDCSSLEQLTTEMDKEYTKLFDTMDKEMEDIFMQPVSDNTNHIEYINYTNPVNYYDFCVLCGVFAHEHFKNHHFIQSKDEHRCLTCNKFFFEHYPHINSCYNPIRAVQYGEN